MKNKCLKIIFGLTCMVLSVSIVVAAEDIAPTDAMSSRSTQNPVSRQCSSTEPSLLVQQSYSFSDQRTGTFPIEFPVQLYNLEGYSANFPSDGRKAVEIQSLKRAPEGGPIVLRLAKPDHIDEKDWQKSYLNGVAGHVTDTGGLADLRRVQMTVREKTIKSLVVDAIMPNNDNTFTNSEWTLVPVLCGGKENSVLGYGSVSVTSVSVTTSWILSIIGIIAFWIAISIASYQINSPRLDSLWNASTGFLKMQYSSNQYAKLVFCTFKSADPIFISQDSLGFGSLARFQILIFTTVVGFVLLFVFIHSGFISGVSNTVLLLLGVTLTGGTLARATGDWVGISPSTRRWLKATGVLEYQRDKPRWSDLFETQGEIDVAKVQALLFTAVISFGIFASGYTGLSNFILPEQTVYLAGLSQGAYVFGKLLPAETRKQVDEDISAMRSSAEKLIGKKGDPQLEAVYEESVKSAKRTLEQTYVERFNSAKFAEKTKSPENVL